MFRKSFKQRGQVLVLYALLIPLFFICVGAGLDLGWYYLNVSRLQNAADAAAVAGASSLRNDTSNFSGYQNKIRLVQQYPANLSYAVPEAQRQAVTIANNTAANYARKNLSSDANATSADEIYTMMSNWSRGGDPTITMKPEIYSDDDKLYYVVHLTEKIHHFFIGSSPLLGGLLADMDAPVVAVAVLTKNPISLTGDEIKALEDLRNGNVIVSNWQIQDIFRKKLSDFNGVTNDYYKQRLEDNGITAPENLYVKAWNEFQDATTHYKKNDLYRTETINIWDDTEILTGKDNNGQDVTMVVFGINSSVRDDNGNYSSLIYTSANINTDKNSAAYNPDAKLLKLDKNGRIQYDENGNIIFQVSTDSEGNIRYNTDGTIKLKTGKANPYTADKLDSIDIDVRPDVNFFSEATEDWDLQFGYDGKNIKYVEGIWDGKDGTRVKNRNILRIHTSINFGKPYEARPGKTTPDILWARIESETMYPVEFQYKKVKQEGLNSVRQYIVNVNESNVNSNGKNYRPVVLFYDGPEKLDPTNSLRDSKPVIVNLNADFCGILYAPNSPVVFNHNNKNFTGFIVAKKYLRLKTAADFEAESDVYKKVGNDFQKIAAEPNPYYKSGNNEPQQINWKYYRAVENGVEMYVDNYGNVQYVELTADEFEAMNHGTYSTFNITDFTSHDYTLRPESENVLFLSGK